MTILKEIRLILVSLESNSNKLWVGTLDSENNVVCAWGRYSERGGQLATAQSKTFPGVGEAFLNKKIKEKERKGYTPLRVVGNDTAIGKPVPTNTLEQLALSQIRYKHSDVPLFLTQLCRANVHNIVSNTTLSYNEKTGLFSTAIGLITPDAIIEARGYLSTINSKLRGESVADEDVISAVNSYLRIVPKDFGRYKVTPSDIFPNVGVVQQQNDILDGLEASLTQVPEKTEEDEASEVETPKIFDTSLDLLEDGVEVRRITELFQDTSKSMHYSVAEAKICRIFLVEVTPMLIGWEAKGSKLNNRKELWHGSSTSNLLSLLKGGYKVNPPATAAIAGKAFGCGVYFAKHSTKSLQYSKGVWNGSYNQGKMYMFLNDVALGNYYVPPTSTRNNPPAGYDSYWAKPGETDYIQNDEIVIFDPAQIKPKYLLELS